MPMLNKTFKIKLTEDWKIQSSEHISQTGQEISTDPNLSTNWLQTQVPTTVLGALVANKVYEDPYFGENLKAIPTQQFKTPWWFITNFTIHPEQADLFAHLNFDGINYKANIWLNGHLIADSKTVDGAYRRTSFDISTYTTVGNNILAVEVIPPKPGDFSTGFVDWNPAPPDGNMGIFRPVTLLLHGGVHIENPFVQTALHYNGNTEAKLLIATELHNDSTLAISGTLIGTIGNIRFTLPITVPPKGKETIKVDPTEFPQLLIKDPKLWWPIHMGEPHLYHLDLTFKIDEQTSSTTSTRFGIRQVSDYWLDDTHRGFKINGKKVLIKGAGWTDDLLLMDTHEKIEAQVNYVKQMNLNCIRLEGFWGNDKKLYDLCDEHGILLMVGWSCHWEHEIHMGVPVNERFGGVYKKEDIAHVAQAWEDQVIWLRNHPSIFVWTVASDKVPITELEEKYIETFAEYDPTRPYLNSTGGVGSDQHVIGSEDVISEISGSSGVKMLGPYAYTAPIYWFTDTKFGGAYGFNTETGPGAQVPQLDSLRKFIPEDKLWPINETWDYHCGMYEFADLSRFTKAINERYGTPESIEEFDKKAQAMNYELMRPMFEAFQVNKKKATGVVQWMLNAAWPKMYWQLYDYYLLPTAAFYAVQKACAPLQLIYNYGDHQIYAVNDYLHSVMDLTAQVQVYDINSEIRFEAEKTFNASPDSAVSLLPLDSLENLSSTYFVNLRLFDSEKKQISTNFYWLSTQEETLDYEADLGEFAFHTPSKQYANLKALSKLPNISLDVSYHIERKKGEQVSVVTLKNSNDCIAFLVHMKIMDKKSGEVIVPVLWDDNFISLIPQEERTIRATFNVDTDVEIKVEGWNVDRTDYNVGPSPKVID